MKKVVVYIDDSALRESVLALLAPRKMVVAEASDSAELIDGACSKSIILTNLPESNIKFLRELREGRTTIASPSVVVLTSQENEKFALQALRKGATSYVPIRLIETELVKTLNSVFGVLNARNSQARIFQCMTDGFHEFVLENDSSLVGPLTRYLQEATECLGLLCTTSELTRMGIAIEEALLNSMYHGNLEVPSALREEDDSKFYDLVEQRRFESPYKDRRVTVQSRLDRDQATFIIRDQGRGFDVASLPDPTEAENVERVSGRGVLLMRTFMDEVRYNELGNEVTMVKRKQTCAEAVANP